jgi:hypothetical protein
MDIKMLPQRALALIRDYSKPLTRPNWRDGSLHAIVFITSLLVQNVFRKIKYNLKRVINTFGYSPYHYEYKYYTIVNSSSNFIQYFGEELIIFTYSKYNCTRYNIEYANFYLYVKNYLNKTLNLHLTYQTINGKKYYTYEKK